MQQQTDLHSNVCMTVRLRNPTTVWRIVVRETGTSRHHEGPIKSHPETHRTWQKYGNQGFKSDLLEGFLSLIFQIFLKKISRYSGQTSRREALSSPEIRGISRNFSCIKHLSAMTKQTAIFPTPRKLFFHLLSYWMGPDRCVSFSFDFKPNWIPFGSKSKGKLSPWLYPIQCGRNWEYSFLSVV